MFQDYGNQTREQYKKIYLGPQGKVKFYAKDPSFKVMETPLNWILQNLGFTNIYQRIHSNEKD